MNGKLPPPPEDVEEGEVEEVGNMGTPPGDVMVVEGEAAEPFPSASSPRVEEGEVEEGEVEEVGKMCTPPIECLTPQLQVIYVCLHASKYMFFHQF
ncbi:hypothetical protein AB205_0101930 [Aquarana catesbeiana]|uniref:Uncharacterized protein n=1 Tax=Aquarana catesbeiana TaxID=8400 RepID=A0A2G9RBL6_AQUCT|nr:hypothetical protein AB205_0101930 [Aquarana catesbeiana]